MAGLQAEACQMVASNPPRWLGSLGQGKGVLLAAAKQSLCSFLPLLSSAQHKTDPYSERQKQWQQIRRGR